MTGLDAILEAIEQDGQRAAQEILSQAREQAEEIGRQGQRDAIRRRGEILEDAPRQARDEAERVRTAAQREQRRILLEARQALIRESIRQAEESLAQLEAADYFAVLLRLAAAHALPQAGEMVLSPRDRERLPADFPGKLQEALPEGASLTISARTEPGIQGGFLLVYGGIEENCTFRALFDAKEEELQDLANRVLFSD